MNMRNRQTGARKCYCAHYHSEREWTWKEAFRKKIDEYNSLIKKKGGNFGAFYSSDVKQLRKIAEDKGGISFKNIVLEGIVNSLYAGFMIGYRAGLREAKAKQG